MPGTNTSTKEDPPFAIIPNPAPLINGDFIPARKIPAPIGINALTAPGAVGKAVLIALETNPAAIAPATTPYASCNGSFDDEILRRAMCF